ncbi:MAG TPA: TIGR04282 family arsenosugar biosynthesis glycosyltransferase [Acidisphaera sp.]|nr:TIGR04282 family arsenosugar biosynthesis glycosyltransferase [Acidisphaera sp.]
MAKAPVPGRSKTRLVPPLTPEAAAALSAAFLRDVTENIVLAADEAPLDPWVAYAPAGSEDGFAGIVAEGTQFVLADGSGDMPPGIEGFGRCLYHAARDLLARGYGGVCLLNSDSPNLPTDILVEMGWQMQPGRIVLGSAADGGYYALGVTEAHPALFAGIDWSTSRVAAQTRAAAGRTGFTRHELPRWFDVDDAPSLRRLLQEMRVSPLDIYEFSRFEAPATAEIVARHGIEDLLRPER